MDKLSVIENSIKKTEEKIASFQDKLRELKQEQLKLENERKLKIINNNNLDEKQLLKAIEMFNQLNNSNKNEQILEQEENIANENN